MKRLCLFLMVAFVGAACAAAEYAIQPRDTLSISVYGHESLSREVSVLDDGGFAYPLVGRVQAAGLTPDALSRKIAAGLTREVADPLVTVSVKQAAPRRVYAGGIVGKPGSYELQAGWRLSHLIAEAGGVTTKPELARAVLVRGDETLTVDLESVINARAREADIALQPGDLLQVQPDTNLIHVVGQVRSPGDFQLKAHLGVLEAVAMAGGVSEDAALTRAQIIRDGRVMRVDLHALLVEGRTDGNLELRAGDTLVLPSNDARIAVLGAVGRPGYYDLPDGKDVTVADALGLAGGALKNARLNEVALVRAVEGNQVVSQLDVARFLKKGELSQNPKVASGDVVFVADGREPLTKGNILSAIVSFTNPFVYSILRR